MAEARTVCFMCSSECGLIVHHESGRLVLRGDPRHPMNLGRLCPKAPLGEALRTSPARLLTPLRRVGDRGSGRFAPVGWDEALGEIGAALGRVREASGPEALTLLFGEKPDHDPFYAFARGFGTPNVLDHNSLCDTSRRLGFALTCGDDQERPLPDLLRPVLTDAGVRERHDCRLLVLFGANPAEARRFFWEWEGIRQAKREGMKLVVVDPFRTRTAEIADVWLPIRPGTDGALILAMLRYAVEADGHDGRYIDGDFVRHQTTGWDEMRTTLLSGESDPDVGAPRHSIEWAAAKTGLATDAIRALAHEFAATKPAAAMVGMNGVAHQYGGFQATRALAMLLAVTGNLDVPGGVLLREPRPPNPLKGDGADAADTSRYKHKDLFGAYPLARHGVAARVPRDILDGIRLRHGPFAGHDYATRALLVVHANPLLTAPETRRWEEAFTARDAAGRYRLRLLVAHDIWVHDTALYADYVLPMAHFLERQGIVFNETPNLTVSLRERVVSPPPGGRSPLEIAQGLAAALGSPARFADLLALRDDDDWCDRLLGDVIDGDGLRPIERLRALGGVWQRPLRYRKYEGRRFRTPSGKVELVSTHLETFGTVTGTPYPSGASYEETPPGAPTTAAEGTFRLVSGRSLAHTNALTQHLGRPGPGPVVWMNTDDAVARGLAAGMDVLLRSRDGRTTVRARLATTDGLRRGVLRGQHGWGARSPYLRPSPPGAHNLNRLTAADAVHPVTGNATFGSALVTVERAPVTVGSESNAPSI